MKKLILFGAGVYAKKYKALLEYLHMDFDYFTDNDASKWGTELYGKKIISPDELTLFPDCQIVISSTHEIAIREQLTKMELAHCLIGLDQLYQLCEQALLLSNVQKIEVLSKRTIFVDMYEGIGWGGSEIWAANLAHGLSESGEKVVLLGGTEQVPMDEQYEKLIYRVSEQETIKHMVNLMETQLPCVFVNNFAGCGFLAAVILKKKYPDLVKIISVIHNDNKSLFDAHMMLGNYIDKIFCVSNQIRRHMQELYVFDVNKYYFKEQPIEENNQWHRMWNKNNTIRIGYAARLVKQQKRADLLIDVIRYLEKAKLDYVLQVAGEGECLAALCSFVQENGLTDKVRLLGRLDKSKMDSFWKDQDVFINISEYEGTSLSMLEAMSYGCVPIVTDVSGAKEFIEDGRNGFVCKVGDLQHIVIRIGQLDKDRTELENFGKRCIHMIAEKCNPQDYIDYWKKYVLEFGNQV